MAQSPICNLVAYHYAVSEQIFGAVLENRRNTCRKVHEMNLTKTDRSHVPQIGPRTRRFPGVLFSH